MFRSLPEHSRSLRLAIPLVLLAVVALRQAVADEKPALGEPVSASELAAIDITVMPDGSGLPAGSGEVSRGAVVFETHCQACHGPKGVDGMNDPLVGGHGSLATKAPKRTVGSYWPYATTLFDYVRRAMPYVAPGSLSNDDVYAVTAYLLYLNGIVPQDARLDAKSLPAVKMPNRDNFRWVYGKREGTR